MAAAAGAEGPVHRGAQLVHEQAVGESRVGELDLAQGQPDAVQGVVAEPAGLGERGPGGGERVPGARDGVGALVLHRVEQVREAAEVPAGLGQRGGVAWPSGQLRGMREGGGRRGLRRLGHHQHGGAEAREGLDARLPVHGVDEHGGVEAERGPGAGSGPVPAAGHLARGQGHGGAGQQPVPVGHVVAHLRGGQHERDGGGEPRALALGHGGGAHAAQRTRARGAPGLGRDARLSLRQNGDEQTVIVCDDPGELAVVSPKCQAQPAQMGHPLRLEPFSQPVRTRPHYAEQAASPVCRTRACRASYRPASFTRTSASPTRTAVAVVFSLSQQR